MFFFGEVKEKGVKNNKGTEMAEASKVRLVRCPKCENLLPEMPDFSLYKCGGCGAILKGTVPIVCWCFLSLYVVLGASLGLAVKLLFFFFEYYY